MKTQVTTWAETRSSYAERFDGAPTFVDDDALAAAFASYPAALLRELDALVVAYDAGKVFAPWRALCSRLSRLERDERPIALKAQEPLCEFCGTILRRNIHSVECPTVTGNGH